MPEIIVKSGDRILHRYPIEKDELSIGRARDNDIVIENLSVSRNHARITKVGDKFSLNDLKSANGTLVNGVRVDTAELAHDDVITIGKHSLHFVYPADHPENIDRDVSAPDKTNGLSIDGKVPVISVLKGRQSGKDFRITRTDTSIGRGPAMDIRIFDWSVSKKHAAIRREKNSYRFFDLESWRGTTVNGHSAKEFSLKDGDEIVLGTTILAFRLVDPATLAPIPSTTAGSEPSAVASAPAEAAADISDEPSQLGIAIEGLHDALPPPPPPPVESLDDEDDDFEDDEFAPMTEEELEALEEEADLHYEHDNRDERVQREAWEMLEAEKLTGTEDLRRSPLQENDAELRAQEERAIPAEAALDIDERFLHEQHDDAEEGIEEASLYGGPMSNKAPFGEPEGDAVAPPVATRPAAAVTPAPAPKTTPTPIGNLTEAKQKEIALWEKALKNKSALIRKNAAKELKKLTGKDYDWTIEPGDA